MAAASPVSSSSSVATPEEVHVTSGRFCAADNCSLNELVSPNHSAEAEPEQQSNCNSSRLSVIVPCYNEAPTVVELLRRVRAALPESQIIVIDDGSTDGSDALVRSVAEELCLETVFCQQNVGKGAAFRKGLKIADREFTIPQDADLEYDPRDINKLLDHAIEKSLDAVYGSRYLESGRSGALPNYLGVKALGIVLRLRFGRALTDPCTCYKLFRTHVLRSYSLASNGFELCQELNARLFLSLDSQVVELPVSYDPRSTGAGKKICARDFLGSFVALLSYSKRFETTSEMKGTSGSVRSCS